MSIDAAPQRPLLVVTDLMGTTLRDDGAVLPAYRAAFAECAIPFTGEERARKRGAHKLSLFTEFAARRYSPDDSAKRGAAALEVFEKQLRHFLAGGGGVPIACTGDADHLLRLVCRGVVAGRVPGGPPGAVADLPGDAENAGASTSLRQRERQYRTRSA